MCRIREHAVVGVRAGDAESEDSAWFEALYSSSYRDVLQYARRRVSAAEADDVVAEVFTTVWRRRGEVTDFGRHRARRRLAMLLAEGISSAVSGSEIR